MIFKSTSYDSIAVKLRLTYRQVRFAISKLKKSEECVTRKSGLFLLVTIVKYDDYQSNKIENVTKNVTGLSQDCHSIVTGLSTNNNVNNDNNVNNVNNIRTMDIKVLKDAYVKNERLHQLIYNSITLKIRLFKLTLRGFLCFSPTLFNFKFLTH